MCAFLTERKERLPCSPTKEAKDMKLMGGHLPNNTPEKGVGPRSEEEAITWPSVVK